MRVSIWLFCLSAIACQSTSAPESLVGNTYRLVSINGRSLPAWYYESADGTYSVGADSARITFLSPAQIRRAVYIKFTNWSPPAQTDHYLVDAVLGLDVRGDSIRILGISDPDRGTATSDSVVLALTVFDQFTSIWRYVRDRHH